VYLTWSSASSVFYTTSHISISAIDLSKYFNKSTLSAFMTSFPTMHQCHLFQNLVNDHHGFLLILVVIKGLQKVDDW